MQITFSRRKLGKNPLIVILKFLTFREHCSIAVANHETIPELKKGWKITHTVDHLGTVNHFVNDLPHRFGGPAVEFKSGSYFYMWAGQIHRLRGPAIGSFDGTEEWWQYGRLHRVNGPAKIHPSGPKIWFLRGIYQKEEEEADTAER